MGKLTLTRRDAILAGAGTALTGGVLSGCASAPAPELDLEDPAVRARVRAKVSGSAAEETVYRFYRLHLYAYMHDANLVPLFTMNNLNVTQCRPLEDNQYAFKVFECGVYCKFDTDEVLESWENPITGEVREPWTFLGGPLNVKMGPDGVETPPEATVHPTPLRMETYGGMVFVPIASHFSYPSPFDPDEWPKESPGRTHYWDSLFVHAARLEDVVNPEINNAPAFCQFQNLVSWGPWVGMGGHAGRSYGRAYGTKLASIDELPAGARKSLELKAPKIFDVENWTEYHDYIEEYKDTYGS